MKKILFVLFLISGLVVSGQKETVITVSKEKLQKTRILRELISEIPEDCKVLSFSFEANYNGELKKFKCMGPGFTSEVLVVTTSLTTGNYFFVEAIESQCPKSHKRNYKLLVD